MRAIVQDGYGSADVLKLRDIGRPSIGEEEVLVRVRAAGVDPGVWHLMTGEPYLVRAMGFGLRKPKVAVRGRDVAGVVEAAGARVTGAYGTRLDPWRGWVRSLTFPLGFLTLGLGFLGILVQREHRALYDLIAGTAVVYAWDARAARLRFLARQAEPAGAAAPAPAKPAAVTADGPSPAGQAGSEAGPDALAESGPHPEPSATGEAPPGTGPAAGQ